METQATFSHLRRSPRKFRLIVDQVRGKKVDAALDLLKFSKKGGSGNVSKLIRSALANASQKQGVNVDTLFVKKIFVNVGPTLKRFNPRARGSADRILKRTSHMTVVLEERI